MFEISINEDADEELNAAAAFYELREPGLGETFLHELSITLQLLAEYPLSCQIMFDPYRRAQIRRFPYGVVYYVGNEKIIVLAVAHSSRRPGYWRKRK
jgi:ribose 5-phosphate isomerase B